MFWKKKGAAATVEDAPAAAASMDPELEGAIDGAAGVLRVLGRHSFDVGDATAASIEETFERWATHILVLEQPPGVAEPLRGRAWKELTRFVAAQRKREREHIVRTTTEMRGAIGTFVNVLGRASIEQGRSAKKIRSRVDRLKASVESSSITELKEHALGVAEAVTQALEEQEKRMEEQTRQLREELTRLREDLDEAKTESSTDQLTQLQNRRAFDAALERNVALATVMQRPVSLVMVDVDRFKLVNDNFGHPFGDCVLKAIADALSRSFRRRCDVVARYGGEEFAVLLGETTQAEANMLTTRLLHAVRALRINKGEQEISVTVSAGVGELRKGENGEELVARCDRALYEAKVSGRDRLIEADAFDAGVSGLRPAFRIVKSTG